MKNLIAIAGVGLLAGGAIGYLAGNRSGSSAGPSETNAPDTGPSSYPSGTPRAVGRTAYGADPDSRPPRSLQDVVNTPGQTARLQALVDLYSGLEPDEFPGEADLLNELPFNERILKAYVLFAAWAEVAPHEAFEHANSKMGRAGMFVRPTILQSWAASDPSAAAAYYQSHKSDFATMGGGWRGGSGAATIAGEWAKRDPDGALAWAKSLGGRERDDASIKAISQIAINDPAQAATLTNGLSGSSLAQANARIAAEWAKNDWEDTDRFIRSLPPGQQTEARGAAVRSLAGNNPARAASEALKLPEGDSREEAIGKVAGSLAREQPAEAAAWVTANGTERAQREAMDELMANWVGQDSAAARDWALQRPEGGLRDSALSQYVINDRETPPRENLRLAESIGDEGARGFAIGVATMRWMAEDRDSALNYLQNTEMISNQTRERILHRSGESLPGRN